MSKFLPTSTGSTILTTSSLSVNTSQKFSVNTSQKFSVNRTSNNIKGFTLVELLVVISIIAFLSVVGITSFTNAQKTARDGRRRADVDAIAKAYESNYNAIAGSYITLVGSHFSNNSIPKDPDETDYFRGLTPSTCTTNSTCTGFYVCADLEVNNGNATSNAAVGIGSTTTGDFYCKKSQLSNTP